MRWFIALLALLLAGSCAHGMCYKTRPYCGYLQTVCSYSADGTCMMCTCQPW